MKPRSIVLKTTINWNLQCYRRDHVISGATITSWQGCSATWLACFLLLVLGLDQEQRTVFKRCAVYLCASYFTIYSIWEAEKNWYYSRLPSTILFEEIPKSAVTASQAFLCDSVTQAPLSILSKTVSLWMTTIVSGIRVATDCSLTTYLMLILGASGSWKGWRSFLGIRRSKGFERGIRTQAKYGWMA